MRSRLRARHQPTPVTIKQVEVEIIDRAGPRAGSRRSPRQSDREEVAVIGSGPAGLAAAQQLARAGHAVTVYERADRIGGLLRYGIPEFKMEKRHLDRRLAQMEAEGTGSSPASTSARTSPSTQLRADLDAVVLATGATAGATSRAGPRADGHLSAMEYLPPPTACSSGDVDSSPIDAAGKHVVIIGGGDTGADCLGPPTARAPGA